MSKKSDHHSLTDLTDQGDDAWAVRNAEKIKQYVAAGLKDVAEGRVSEFDPRDPQAFLDRARRDLKRAAKATA